MKNIVIDLGNYNTKFVGDKKGNFSSKFSTGFNANGEAFESVSFNNKTTYISVGELDREYNKVDKNYMPIALYGLNKATSDTNVNLCLLLPVNQLLNKGKLIEQFKGKQFEYKVNDKVVKKYIHNVAILPEGYVSYYSLDQVEANKRDIILIDIGSRTINVASFIEGKLERNFTIKLGIFDLYRIIKELENAKGNDYVEEDIERLIKRKKIIVADQVYLDFLKQVLNAVKGNINIKNYDVIFAAGGSLVLKTYIEENTPATIHPEGLYSNALGALNLCNQVWK
ncbi:MAG: ParM/StbA family protein [Clostridium sp.]